MKVMLGMPMGAGMPVHAIAAWAFHHASRDEEVKVARTMASSSAGHMNHDNCLAAALNAHGAGECDIFAMQHADVCCEPGWLDVLLAEMKRLGADIVSAVIPQKSLEGITSTAVEREDTWNPRRLTIREVFDQPETFTLPGILLNTGLYVLDLRKPWVHLTNPDGTLQFSHTMENRIIQKEGTWIAEMRSEDWNLSRVAHRHGAKLYATRKTRLFHEHQWCHNTTAWGTATTDPLRLEAA